MATKLELQAFTHSLSKLIEQGRPALDTHQGSGVLLAKDGARCALGWLIPEDTLKANRTPMGYTLGGTSTFHILADAQYRKLAKHFLALLTGMHDRAATNAFTDAQFMENLRIEAVQVAVSMHIDTKLVDELFSAAQSKNERDPGNPGPLPPNQ